MRVAIKKWGNSAAMIIPVTLLNQLHIQVGQELVAEVIGKKLVLKTGKPELCPRGGICHITVMRWHTYAERCTD